MPMSDKIVDQLRPRTVDGIIGQEQIMEYTRRWLKRKHIPDCILVGPPGSGKTTWALVVVSELFGGADVWDSSPPDLLILNASDDRGIETVRNNIKDFAGSLPASDVPFRVIILEEGDQLTPDAQNALRSTVEEYSDTCRFIYLGNDETYIPAIKSRCAILRFTALSIDVAKGFFEVACEKYNVSLESGISEIVATFYEGDLRSMLNDCLEKLVGIERAVKKSDLDFSMDIKSTAVKIMAILHDPKLKPTEKYSDARKYFTTQHAKTKFNMREFLKVFQNLLGQLTFNTAEYFSTIDDRLRKSNRNKEVHIGALFAKIVKEEEH